jgi:hypothetical protein
MGLGFRIWRRFVSSVRRHFHDYITVSVDRYASYFAAGGFRRLDGCGDIALSKGETVAWHEWGRRFVSSRIQFGH